MSLAVAPVEFCSLALTIEMSELPFLAVSRRLLQITGLDKKSLRVREDIMKSMQMIASVLLLASLVGKLHSPGLT